MKLKARVIQPPYSRDLSRADELFRRKLDMLDACDGSDDVIVLPEYSDVPCAASSREETLRLHEKYAPALHEACIRTARRCRAFVFVNTLRMAEDGYRNTTFAYDREGNLAGMYDKRHLPPVETETEGLDETYTLTPQAPYVLELEGIRFGFLTCYDFYFYESFARIAREKVDVIVGCSLQRSDTHEAIETMCRFLAYNTNAWVLRASVSFREDSDVCGASMIVSPKGEVLENLKGRFGSAAAVFDTADKYYKAAGYGNPPAAHWEYAERGRRPWQYRPAGPAIVPFDDLMPYPRLCAHRGFSTVAPENTMPAFGAAVAMGAEEIEFDLWSSADGVLVSCHDDTLERVSDGSGKIYEHTWDELRRLDFGAKSGERFRGLRIARFEDILRKFSGQVIMNIHVKIWDAGQADDKLEEIVSLLRQYDCQRHCYFMTTNDDMIRKAMSYAPEIPCCVGWDGNEDPMSMVDRAVALGAYKVQLFKPYFNAETVKRAHEHGILCNVFWSDDPEEAREFRAMGIDTILTNDYLTILRALEKTD